MTRDELIEFLQAAITRTAERAPDVLRPQGTFVGNVASRTLSGLRLGASDGTIFYLAVLEADEFANAEVQR